MVTSCVVVDRYQVLCLWLLPFGATFRLLCPDLSFGPTLNQFDTMVLPRCFVERHEILSNVPQLISQQHCAVCAHYVPVSHVLN